MGFKTLTIKEDVYNELINVKGKNESFSEFFAKIVKKMRGSPDLKSYYGAWKNMPKKDFENVELGIKRIRVSADKNFRERVKKAIK